jgi:hypothetical protein
MSEEVTRYPLSWPHGWKRTPANNREPVSFREGAMVERSNYETVDGRFQRVTKQVKGSKTVTLPTARGRLAQQLEFLGAQSIVVSTNMELTRYGEPRADRTAPADPGVAVYFELKGKDRVLACDKWISVAGNMAAIANHIDAIRRVDRYGVGTLDQAFAGYDALPPPGADNRAPWRGMLGFKPGAVVTRADVDLMYRAAAKQAAADEGALLQLNLAREAAYKELSA